MNLYPKVTHKDWRSIAEIICILLTPSNMRKTDQPGPCRVYTAFEKIRAIQK